MARVYEDLPSFVLVAFAERSRVEKLGYDGPILHCGMCMTMTKETLCLKSFITHRQTATLPRCYNCGGKLELKPIDEEG